mmetsp:Transcript_21532/g.50626  ORF Transcript_21532/g.50626 Transcript_21532/m.50626 type:complete len:271 (-) Transcript_21532:396-1208(-)
MFPDANRTSLRSPKPIPLRVSSSTEGESFFNKTRNGASCSLLVNLDLRSSSVTTFFRLPLASSVSVPGPANGSSFSGSFVTTTTASSYGIHMYLMCLCLLSIVGSCSLASDRVNTKVCSTSRCAGMTLSVTSLSIPSPPSPSLARRNSSPWLFSVMRTVPAGDGVTIVSSVTNSSHGGMDAPVPCAPTLTKPPICCSAMDAKLGSVSPCGRRASSTCDTRAPASTLTVIVSLLISIILSRFDRPTMPLELKDSPLGERAEPTGRIDFPVS